MVADGSLAVLCDLILELAALVDNYSPSQPGEGESLYARGGGSTLHPVSLEMVLLLIVAEPTPGKKITTCKVSIFGNAAHHPNSFDVVSNIIGQTPMEGRNLRVLIYSRRVLTEIQLMGRAVAVEGKEEASWRQA